jgi:succinoglycan biosynthesis protein ExoM
MQTPKPHVTILIPTFRRPDGLERLLRALPAAVADAPRSIEVIVADNDESCSAAAVFDRHASALPCPARYIHQPVPGISETRNALLAAAPNADFVVFIDDDEEPRQGWVAALIEAAERFHADVVTGPIVYEFEETPSALVGSAPCFTTENRRTGSAVRWPSTANVLIRNSILEGTGIRFREHFSLSGGGDTLLFEELFRAGARAIWSAHAVVLARVPPERSRAKWVFRRGVRIGNTTARVERELRPTLRTVTIRAAKAAGWVATGLGRLLAGALCRRPAATSAGLYHLGRGLGMIAGLMGRPVMEYRRPAHRPTG